MPLAVTELERPPAVDVTSVAHSRPPATEPTPPQRRASVAVLVLMVGFPAALLVAVATGVLAVQGVSRAELAMPLAALVGLGFVALGIARFEWFVLAVLSIRTLVDFTRVAPDAAQPGGPQRWG